MHIFGIHKTIDNVFSPGDTLKQIDSFQWTEHFAEIGNFEIKLPFSLDLRDFLKKYKYLILSGSHRPMRIRSVHVKKEEGRLLCTLRGETLDYILRYRYVQGAGTTSQTYVDRPTVRVSSDNETSWNYYMMHLLRNYTKINIYLRDRFRIQNVSYGTPPGIPFSPYIDRDPEIVRVNKGTSFYEVLKEAHRESDGRVGFAFQIALTVTNYGGLYFTAHSQRDLTEDVNRKALVFSSEDNSLMELEYLYTEEEQYTGVTAYMDYFTGNSNETQRENQTRYMHLTPEGVISGDDFERRMAYITVEYKDLVEEGNPPTINKAYQEARDRFKGKIPTDTYMEGVVSPHTDYVYGRDYILGDIAWVQTPFGNYEKGRITTQTFVKDEKGITSFPTLTDIGNI